MAHDGAHDEAGKDEEDAEEKRVDQLMRQTPAYPFPADFRLEFQGVGIEACQHLCRRHPEGTRAIALFFPGVHGGVGPCRQPGANFDEEALYATVCNKLTVVHGSDVDCYRCSWPFMRPRMSFAVGGACRVLHHALLEAMKSASDAVQEPRTIRVYFIGHSLGGAVAARAADVVAAHFGAQVDGGKRMEGLERAVVQVAGLCTLNGAITLEGEKKPFEHLHESRALVICGDADDVVPPISTAQLFEALPMQDKRHLVLPGGSHDLFTFKEQLIEELTQFVLDDIGPAATDVDLELPVDVASVTEAPVETQAETDFRDSASNPAP